MNFDKIKNIIDLYYSKRKGNSDYFIVLDEEIEVDIINPNTGERTSQKMKEVGTGINLLSHDGKFVSKELIEAYSPDNIDSKEFWKYAVEKFPLYSISGYNECKNEEDVNKANLNLAIWSGMIKRIQDEVKVRPNSSFLEIGPGYGNIFNYITKTHNQCQYLAIDINPLFYYDGLFECDGSTIPTEAGNNFDYIFSINVFQHLSKLQRTSYYKDIYDKLKVGGKFVFSNFLLTDSNKDIEELWSYKDEEKKCYTSFFTQLTPVDSYEELADELNDIGFSIKVSVKQNTATIECVK